MIKETIIAGGKTVFASGTFLSTGSCDDAIVIKGDNDSEIRFNIVFKDDGNKAENVTIEDAGNGAGNILLYNFNNPIGTAITSLPIGRVSGTPLFMSAFIIRPNASARIWAINYALSMGQ